MTCASSPKAPEMMQTEEWGRNTSPLRTGNRTASDNGSDSLSTLPASNSGDDITLRSSFPVSPGSFASLAFDEWDDHSCGEENGGVVPLTEAEVDAILAAPAKEKKCFVPTLRREAAAGTKTVPPSLPTPSTHSVPESVCNEPPQQELWSDSMPQQDDAEPSDGSALNHSATPWNAGPPPTTAHNVPPTCLPSEPHSPTEGSNATFGPSFDPYAPPYVPQNNEFPTDTESPEWALRMAELELQVEGQVSADTAAALSMHGESPMFPDAPTFPLGPHPYGGPGWASAPHSPMLPPGAGNPVEGSVVGVPLGGGNGGRPPHWNAPVSPQAAAERWGPWANTAAAWR